MVVATLVYPQKCSVETMLQLNFFLILGSIKSSYLGPVKRQKKKEENRHKKIEKELQ